MNNQIEPINRMTGAFETIVAGVSFYQEALEKICGGREQRKVLSGSGRLKSYLMMIIPMILVQSELKLKGRQLDILAEKPPVYGVVK